MAGSVAPQSAAVAAVPCSTTVATLLAAAAGRRMVTITNATASSVLFIKFGPGASTTDYSIRLAANGYYEMPVPLYGGIITGILDTGTGNAQVTTW